LGGEIGGVPAKDTLEVLIVPTRDPADFPFARLEDEKQFCFAVLALVLCRIIRDVVAKPLLVNLQCIWRVQSFAKTPCESKIP
jgi:hypothetical protein